MGDIVMYEDDEDILYRLNDYIQKSAEEYTSNEKQLFALLIAIWENRRFINNDDLNNLKFFKEKGL